LDSSVSFGEPGYEERETIEHGALVASKSGFTDIILNPNTDPVLDKQTDISFVKLKSKNATCNIHPLGALSISSKSVDMAELFDMKNAGAVGFYDFKKPIKNSNLLKTSLLYSQSFDSLIMSFPLDESISKNGIINEGVISLNYGIKGIPNFSEEVQINRDLQILEYTGGRLHIPTISTKKSVELIKNAKSKGLMVTCSVAIHNLIFNETKLKDFDTRFKVLPPLRSEEDRLALIEAVDKGIIDLVTLESFFGSLLTIFPLEKTIEILTRGKDIFKIEETTLNEGSLAKLSLFTVSDEYEFSKENILSKSKNSAFLGLKMKGKPYGIINSEKICINE